jgi:hypothetical protein
MGTGSGSVSRACPASSKCAAHEREQSSVCVNKFTPLQLIVENENAAVARVIKELQHTPPPPPAGYVCGRWWF